MAAVVGADRIARNGDVANKIGTLGVAASASLFDVPFYVAAPHTTLDPATATGRANPHRIAGGRGDRPVRRRRVVPSRLGCATRSST